MKKKICLIVSGVVLITGFLSGVLYAKPERKEIKAESRREKERIAKEDIRKINLQRIEDPEARKAIGTILDYLQAAGRNGTRN